MLTKKDLEMQVQDLQQQLSHCANLTVEDQVQLEDELRTSQEALTEAQVQLTAAQEAAAAAETALQAQIEQAPTSSTTGVAPLVDQVNLALIPRPTGAGWSIRESMQVTKLEYAEIQRTIRSLVIRATLDWTEDFRHQDPEKLTTLFRAARLAHPVLCHYANNWAMAAIACQYMQNKRYKQGYISKWHTHQVVGQENLPAA